MWRPEALESESALDSVLLAFHKDVVDGNRDLPVVYSCAHCTSVETETLVLEGGIVSGGQAGMGSGMGRGRASAEGAGSWLSTGHSTPPPTQHEGLSSYFTPSPVQCSGGVQSRGF